MIIYQNLKVISPKSFHFYLLILKNFSLINMILILMYSIQ